MPSERTPEEDTASRNNGRIEMHQSEQTTQLHNGEPESVDPIAWRRLAVSSRNVAINIQWPHRVTNEQFILSWHFQRWTTTRSLTRVRFLLFQLCNNTFNTYSCRRCLSLTLSTCSCRYIVMPNMANVSAGKPNFVHANREAVEATWLLMFFLGDQRIVWQWKLIALQNNKLYL